MSIEARYCGRHGTHDTCWRNAADDPPDHSIADEMLEALRRERDALREMLNVACLERDHYRDTVGRMEGALTANRQAMALFASVIQSGEPWTPYCRDALHKANEATHALAEPVDP